MSFYSGKIQEVNPQLLTRSVTILDSESGEQKTFPYERAITGSVFREMQRIGQPLAVTVDGDGSIEFEALSFSIVKTVKELTDSSLELQVVGSRSRKLLLPAEKGKQQYYTNLRNLKVKQGFWILTAKKPLSKDGNQVEVRAVFDFDPVPPRAIEQFDSLEAGPSLDVSELTELSYTDAQDLFFMIQSHSTQPRIAPTVGIPFLAVEEGCEYRCHAMAKLLLDVGVIPCKVWVSFHQTNAKFLKFDTDLVKACFVEWIYHTAIGIKVVGESEIYVIDPATCGNAVPYSSWQDRFSEPDSRQPLPECPANVLIVNLDGSFGPLDPDNTLTDLKLSAARNVLHLQYISKSPPPYFCSLSTS
jgi:hypothetical protein